MKKKFCIHTSDKIESQATKIKQQIDDYYTQLENKLRQQREGFKRILHEVSAQKKKAVMLQQQQLLHVRAQLERLKELNEVVKSESDHQEALYMKKQVTTDVKRLEAEYEQLNTKPVELANINFSEHYEQYFPFFGSLFYDNTFPSNIATAYIVPLYGQVGKEFNFNIITTKDDNQYPCQNESSKVSAQVQSRTGDVIAAEVENNQDGSYTASFIPSQPGEVEVTVTINGESINMYPLSIQVHHHTTLDKPSKIVNDGGNMGHTWGIAFGKDGIWASYN